MISLLPREKPLHVFLFPLLFILNHFFKITAPNVHHANEIGYWMFNFVIAVILCCGVSWLTYRIFLLKFNQAKSGLFSTAILLPFFFFQDLFLSMEKLTFAGLRARWVLPIFAFIFLRAIYGLMKTKRSLSAINQYLNLSSAALVVYMAVEVSVRFYRDPPNPLTEIPSPRKVKCKECPDVFLLVLDAYTSNQSLKEFFGFDNTKFSENLSARGFAVANQAISSYTRTEYSVSAILNFDQVANLNQYTSIGNSIRESAVIKSFKDAGFEIHNYSIFQIDDQKPYYGLTPSLSMSSLQAILECSILNMAVYDVNLKLSLYRTHLNVLKNISESPKKEKRPRFFYGHVLAPHPPFVIDNLGNEIAIINQPKSFNNQLGYVEEVKGLNGLILDAVDKILEKSPEAVIILTGDHGYRYFSDPSKIEESKTVFLAYRGPRKEEIFSLRKSNGIFEVVLRGLE